MHNAHVDEFKVNPKIGFNISKFLAKLLHFCWKSFKNSMTNIKKSVSANKIFVMNFIAHILA